ncbi:MAG: class I SAM-dependent methyltransferase, partial [Crocosphaera sp.]
MIEATNLKTPIEDLYPKISDEGKELSQQWIEKYSAAKSVFYEVAELVKAEVEKWTATTGEKPTYRQILRQLLANDLVKKFQKMRTGPAAFVFNAARADIQADTDYQKRIKDWENTAKDRLNLNPQLEMPFYVTRPNFHWCPYVATNDWEEQFLGCVWDIGTSIMGQSSPTIRSYNLGGGRLSRMVDYLSEHFPNFKPQRILDIGCSAGGSTIAMAMEFPEAEIHGID